MAHLITGYAGFEHIMSADQGSFNAAFFGGGCFVMEAGNMMEASIINNNTVRVLDGDLLMYGRHIRIEPNTYEDITIDTGTAGKERFDLIVMTYEKNTSDGTETARLEVIKGIPSDGSPITPVYTDGNILEGATVCQFPLYKVHINGVVLEEVEQLFKTVSTFQTTAEQYEAEFQEACNTYLGSLNILDTMEEVNANTQPNQLAGALAVKELFQSVSNGKSLIASAITDKGVPTPAGATFQQMADNIGQLGGEASFGAVITKTATKQNAANTENVSVSLSLSAGTYLITANSATGGYNAPAGTDWKINSITCAANNGSITQLQKEITKGNRAYLCAYVGYITLTQAATVTFTVNAYCDISGGIVTVQRITAVPVTVE